MFECDAARGLHALVTLLGAMAPDADASSSPRELADLIRPIYQQIAGAMELDAPGGAKVAA